ncbi:hypothetical protein [Porphyrobacter sp. AAP60]|uniref:hypothetical protein n=1 Tax=Porphyrobacter sp. AAP60 TaxID=1523423 RepID=UPI0006B907EF|nr:hypothetical protein [Porphyrobacter sp. AAP60]KPF63931.1 hypothetical protein IP79_09015 [Porphyrobacter sp. AAP60]
MIFAMRTGSRLLAAALALLTAQAAAAQDGGWRLEPDARIEVQAVSAQTTTRDEDLVIDGEAISLRGQIGLALNSDATRFRLEADRIEVFRLGEGRRDLSRDRFTATVQHDVSKALEVQLQARHYDDVVTVESADTDEWQGSARISFEPTRANRFRLQGTWRDRQYDNGARPATTGEGPRIDAQYRHRFGRYHYLAFDLRTENIRSDDPARGYERDSAGVAYTRPVTKDLRVRPAIEVIKTRFDGRIADNGALRRDRQVVPEVELLWWPGKWRVEAEAKYVFFNSNEATRERQGYRLTLSVGRVF